MQFILTEKEYDQLMPKSEYIQTIQVLKSAVEILFEESKLDCLLKKPYYGYCNDCKIHNFIKSRVPNKGHICPVTGHTFNYSK